jgi:hypothetical protein
MLGRRIAGVVGALIAASLISGCAGSPAASQVSGSGNVVTESRAVTGFSAIEVTGPVKAVVHTGPYAVSVRADDNLLPLITTEANGTTLRVGIASSSSITNAKAMAVDITLPDLAAATGQSAARLELVDISVAELRLTLQAASHITGNGTADRIDLTAGAASVAQLADLHARQIAVSLHSASVAVVMATDAVSGEAHQASVLTVRGNPPTVTVATSEMSIVNR